MIIQCEQCQTRFRLDDSKVTDKGVKVRCAKCKHVFTVNKEQPEAVEPHADFSALLDESVSSGSAAGDAAPPISPQESPQQDFAPESPIDFDDSAVGSDSFSFDQAVEEQIPAPGEDDFNLSSLQDDRGFTFDQEEAGQESGEVDFSGFDFGDLPADADKTLLADAPASDLGDMTIVQSPAAPVAAEEDFSGFDFGGETLFGDAVAVPADEEPDKPITFDFQMEEFADSMGVDTVTGNIKAEQGESGGDEPFSLGEIDFGDELTSVAVQQVHPDELQPSQELLFAPLAEAQIKPVQAEENNVRTGSAAESAQAVQEELPPLSIPSRRKQSPVFSGLIVFVSLLLVAVLGFFGYSMFTEGKGKVVAESGRISVRSVEASFVVNPLIGELLVITGEAVNEYAKPRAALQVKGMVYGANGQTLATKNAYCGNPLTKEQLATLPADKIEAAMANQFGDSLANMEVVAGKAIPFVIVISKPPAEARDYGVEPVGSTVAAGK